MVRFHTAEFEWSHCQCRSKWREYLEGSRSRGPGTLQYMSPTTHS